MSIDWDLIFNANLEELNDEKAELLYDQLIEYIPKNEDDAERLSRLFSVCKSVMQIKALQADVAVEELEEMVKKQYDKSEIEHLKKELDIYKQLNSSGGDVTQRLKDATQEIMQLKNKVESRDNDAIKMKRKVNDLQNNIDNKDKEIQSLRSEIDSLKEEFDSQRQFDEQIVEQKQEPIEKLREKNKQIQSLLDELRDMENVNLDLAKQIKHFKLQLYNANNDMKINSNELVMVKSQIQELNSLNDEFIKQKIYFENEIKLLRETIDRYEREDDTIAAKFNEKIEQLRKVMQFKDDEIIQLRRLNHSDTGIGDDYQKILLNKEIKERDNQIELLKSQLTDTVNDMEAQTEIIQKMLQNRNEDHVTALNEQIEGLNKKLKQIEDETQVKDENLLNLRKKINMYEKGEYGLSEALKDINDLTKHLQHRDKRIEDLVQQINELKLQLNDAADEIDQLKDGDYNKVDPEKSVSSKGRGRMREEKVKSLEMQQQLLKLEEEKISLCEELRQVKGGIPLKFQKEKQQIESLTLHIKEIESENMQLQLGMKEILNGLRESDSVSDVIIECPSLERLSQLLESRTLSHDLSNVIALKAELDLVRGHNEQIRMEMKRLRNDHLKLIAMYTQDLLESDSFVVVKEDRGTNTEFYVTEDTIENKKIEIQENDNTKEIEEIIEKPFVPLTPLKSLEKPLCVDKETQYIDNNDNLPLENIPENTPENIPDNIPQREITIIGIECGVQTEEFINNLNNNNNQLTYKCKNCQKVSKVMESLNSCVNRLQENIKLNEDKYIQHINLLKRENEDLIENFNTKLKAKDDFIRQKDDEICSVQRKLRKTESELKYDDSIQNSDKHTEPSNKVSSSCSSVLESIINCLQARIDHKDESLKQYQNMLSEVKQNFENEMIRLIESHYEDTQKRLIGYEQMIDNEELQSALHNCVNELETCKLELNARIENLETELKNSNDKFKVIQNENDQLKLKRINPNVQLKKEIESLKEQCNEKDTIINNLNKTIKDERIMRMMSATRKSKKDMEINSQKNSKCDHSNDKEFTNLRAEIETLKTKIKEMEINKWEMEKRIRDVNEQCKIKLQEKSNEIIHIEKSFEKAKTLITKYENERHSMQSKIMKISAKKDSIGKSSDDQRHNNKHLLKSLNDKALQNDIEKLKQELDAHRVKEEELKILLQESLQREKLATIYEEKLDLDQHYEILLQENARLKVELRMAEFELRRHKETK